MLTLEKLSSRRRVILGSCPPPKSRGADTSRRLGSVGLGGGRHGRSASAAAVGTVGRHRRRSVGFGGGLLVKKKKQVLARAFRDFKVP